MKFGTSASVLFALMASIASARVGVGSCPSLTSVQNAFGTNGVVPDGVYNLYKLDPQFKWGWSTFASRAGETLNCKSVNFAKTSNGFSYSQNSIATLPASMRTTCDATSCESFFPSARLQALYYDAAEPTVVLYTCLDLKQAADFFIQTFGGSIPPFWQNLIKSTYGWLSNIHYSMMIVAA
jgi:hypothetical protein